MKKPVLNKPITIFIFSVIIALILYGKSINHAYNIDDNYVVENHELVKKGIKGIPEIFGSRYHSERDQFFGYRPLTIAMFSVETSIFGENTRIHHLINILLYALLILALYKLMKNLWPGISQGFLWVVLLIYMVHPIHTEVVLSLKNREEILCFLLGILAWQQALKFFESKKWYQLTLSILSLGLSFLAKETAIIFLAVIPVSIFYFKVPHLTNTGKEKTGPVNKTRIPYIQLALFLIMLWKPDFLPTTISVMGSAFLILGVSFWQKRRISKQIDWKNPLLIAGLISFLLYFVFSFIGYSSWRIFLYITGALISIYASNLINFKRKGEKIKIPGAYLMLAVFILLGGIIIAAVHFIPDSLLPKQNAPVYHWQNPLFSDNSFSSKFGIVFYSLGFYLKLLFIPAPLRFYYGYAIIPNAGIGNPVVIISFIVHIALFYILVKGLKKRSILSFAILFYLIGIFPFSNIVFPLTGIVGERLLFIPSFGFAIAISYLIFRLAKTDIFLQGKASIKPAVAGLALIVIIPFSALSMQRVPDWKDRETLYNADISKLEKSAKANNLYANYLIAKVYAGMKQGVPLQQMDGMIHQSIDYFNKALAVDSTYANSYHNLGYIYLIIGKDYPRAEAYFTQCLATDSTVPEAWMNRGISRFQQGRYEEALKDLESSRSFHLNKEMDKIFYYLGQIYEIRADSDMAAQMYDSALYYNPQQLSILTKRRQLSLDQKDYEEAIFYQGKITEIAAPDNDKVWVDMGNYSLLSGDTLAAVSAWEKAFDIFPGNFNIGMTLSQYYAGKGNQEKSVYFRDKALMNKR